MNCTKCGSIYIEERRIGAGVGVVAGGVAGGFAASSCFTSNDDTDEGFGILGFLTSVTIGAAAGTIAGSLLDGSAIDNYKCNDCGHTFKAGDDPMDRAAKALSTLKDPEYGNLVNSTVRKRNIFETAGTEASDDGILSGNSPLGEYTRNTKKEMDDDIKDDEVEKIYITLSDTEAHSELSLDQYNELVKLYGKREEYVIYQNSKEFKNMSILLQAGLSRISTDRQFGDINKPLSPELAAIPVPKNLFDTSAPEPENRFFSDMVPKYLRASKEELRKELDDEDFEYLVYLYGDRKEYMFDRTSPTYESVPVMIHLAVLAITMVKLIDKTKKEWKEKYNQA